MPVLGGAAAFFVALLLGPLVALVARRRWRLEEARRREVMRLAILAAQEAARAEEEAAGLLSGGGPKFAPLEGGDGRVGAPRSMECAVCSCPTTTRCSRCKAVRYCSGKCQIIHWRQGHKYVCFPPEVDNGSDDGVSISKLKGVTVESSLYDVRPDSAEAYRSSENEPTVVLCQRSSSGSSYSSEAFSDDTLGTENTTDSSSDSSSSISEPVNMSYGPISDHYSSHDGANTTMQDESHGKLINTIPCGVTDLKEHAPTGLNGITVSGNNIHCINRSDKKPFWSTPKSYERKSSVDLSSEVIKPRRSVSNETSIGFSEYENANNGQNVANRSCVVGSTSSLCEDENDSEINNGSDIISELLDEEMCFQARSSSSSISSITPTLADKTRSLQTSVGAKEVQLKTFESPLSVSAHKVSQYGQYRQDAFRKGDSTPVSSAITHQLAGADPNGIRQSVQKAVHHLRFAKVLKQHKPGSNTSGQMLFPYDCFVKLYTLDKVELRPAGLSNCGNSCYANAVLQSLIFTPPLTAYLLQGLHSKTCLTREWCFICELENLVQKVKQGHSPLSPTGILRHIHKIGSHLCRGREEDAHEFLRYAIDAMQFVCLKEARNYMNRWAEESTLMHLTFGGYLRSKIKCMKCHYKSERHERMMDLTVEIQGDIGTLEEALGRFTSTEVLDGENKYLCNRCKSYEKAKKKLTVLEAPNILTIALKRFQSGKFGKLNKAIRFPEKLDLAPYMSMQNDKTQLYRLYAVVVHLDVMNAAFSGHYVCYVRNSLGKWYKTDDSMVKSVELERVLSKKAYMLLYARCSPHAPSLRRLPMPPDQVTTKKSKPKESVYSSYAKEKLRSNNAFSSHVASTDRAEKTIFPRTDSSSDSSSLFSYSDEASCSTESTRDSTSTEDFSEYIFGDLDHYNWNSPSRFSANSDDVLCSPSSSHESSSRVPDGAVGNRAWHETRERYVEAESGAPFLFSNTTTQARRLTEQSRYDQVDLTNLMNGQLFRNSTTRERRAQALYC